MLSVIMHQCAILITLLTVSQVVCLAPSPSVTPLPEQLRLCLCVHVSRQSQPLPCLVTERATTTGGGSLGICRVLHLIVGVLDDAVEGGHQGLLQVEAAGVAGDLGVWQGLE